MDTKTLTAVIVTALVVALLTSLITVKLTGNVVNLPTVYPSPTNYTTVYTKAEVDSKLTSFVDFKGFNKITSNYLGGCVTTGYSYIWSTSGIINGTSLCSGLGNYQCVFGSMLGNYDKTDYAALDTSGFAPCNYNIQRGSDLTGHTSVSYLCCKK